MMYKRVHPSGRTQYSGVRRTLQVTDLTLEWSTVQLQTPLVDQITTEVLGHNMLMH